MKIAYIAHPISGDVLGNLGKIRSIVRKINLEEPDVVPLVNYFVDCYSLDDNVPEERDRGIKNSIEILKRCPIDELRLYGNRISPGMWAEIAIARGNDIYIRPMTEETKQEFNKVSTL